MSGWSSTRATRKRRTRSWPKERVTTTRSPATPPLLVAFHPPWAVIYLTDKVAREVAECSPTPLSKPDLCYSHHAARWLPRAASTMSRQSTVPRSVNKTSFIRRYLCWRGERPQARRTGPVVSTTASRSVTNVSNESLRPRGQRFARDSPLEGDGFELVWGFSCQVVVLGFAESSVFGAGKPFFIPSPAIRFAERAEGVKGPKR